MKKTYKVIVHLSESNTYKIEAENDEEARELVLSGDSEHLKTDGSSEIEQVEVYLYD